jgi:hypothetical protein
VATSPSRCSPTRLAVGGRDPERFSDEQILDLGMTIAVSWDTDSGMSARVALNQQVKEGVVVHSGGDPGGAPWSRRRRWAYETGNWGTTYLVIAMM